MGQKLRSSEVRLERVGPENQPSCGIGCITNEKLGGYHAKVGWLHSRFAEGLRFLLFRAGAKPLAFLEYVPGEYAWRPVDAKGWLFIHCLWVYPAGQKIGRLGSRLIRACVDEAQRGRFIGVAAVVSDGPWMAGRQVFIRNGFEQVEECGRFQFVVHRLKKGPLPRFRDVDARWAKQRGLHVVYAPQCPYLSKSVSDLSTVAREHGLELQVTLLTSARDAQTAPTHYGVFGLLWNGRVLSDHYVSARRFQNILRKEVLDR